MLSQSRNALVLICSKMEVVHGYIVAERWEEINLVHEAIEMGRIRPGKEKNADTR